MVDDHAGRSEFVVRPPAPALRPFIAWYVGYRDSGLAPARHRGLPSPYLTLIVTLDEQLAIAAHPDPRAAPDRYDTLIGGLHTAPAIITHDGRQSGIQIALSPLGSRVVVGVPAGELAGVDLHADSVLGSFATTLREQVVAAAGWDERFAAVDRLLTMRIDRAPPLSIAPQVEWVWRRLLGAGGTAVAVESLAAEAGWSSRNLRKRFAAEIGLSPKAAARVVRFDRARRLLQRRAMAGGDGDLAMLAATCGYYDQAHLAREFGQLAGCSPTRLLTEEFRNIQAETAVPLPHSQV